MSSVTSSVRGPLTFPEPDAKQLEPYLPDHPASAGTVYKPYVTLSYASSLDASVAIAPGVRTLLSGPQSGAMTHYLRSKHDAILIGVGTADIDDPSLNCRLDGVGGYGGEDLEGQPRPVILDPNGRWDVSVTSKVICLAREEKGKGPWWMVWDEAKVPNDKRRVVETVGGKIIKIPPLLFGRSEDGKSKMAWNQVFTSLSTNGIKSVMIEGGGAIINDLLSPRYFPLIDSVIITVAPTWLGKGAIQIYPERRQERERGSRVPAGRLRQVKWLPLGEDVVLCGRPKA